MTYTRDSFQQLSETYSSIVEGNVYVKSDRNPNTGNPKKLKTDTKPKTKTTKMSKPPYEVVAASHELQGEVVEAKKDDTYDEPNWEKRKKNNEKARKEMQKDAKDSGYTDIALKASLSKGAGRMSEAIEMSKKAWKKTHKDFRNDDEKSPRVLKLNPKTQGTESHPVTFTKEDSEYGYDKDGKSLNPKDQKKEKLPDMRELPTRINLVKNKLRAMGLKMSQELTGDQLAEVAAHVNEGKKKGLDGKACWDGYKLDGTKKKGGKTVDNCVKEGDYHSGQGEKIQKRTKDWMDDKGQEGAPGLDAMKERTKEHKKKRGVKKNDVTEGAAWTKKSGKSPSGGLNEKGRKSYERQNPGSDLKAPQPEGGSRKKSFCSRMGGMKKKLTSSKTANDPDSRINKALRKWKCNEEAGGETVDGKFMSYATMKAKGIKPKKSALDSVKDKYKGQIYDPKKVKKPSKADQAKATADRKKRQEADSKAYAARAKKAGFKSTQDYTDVVARYGSEDNYKKGKGLGT